MSHRSDRVAEAFREEVMGMIQKTLKDPAIGFVTVTHVDVSPDLTHAVFLVTVLGDEEQQKASLAALNRAKGFIRTELGKRVRLKFLPEIRFERDKSIDESFKVSEIIKKLGQKGNEQ